MDGARDGDARRELVLGLTKACSRHFDRAVRVDGLFRHSGGASRQTWGFDAILDDGSVLKLVLRRDPPHAADAPPQSFENSLAIDRATEFAVMRAAGLHGVPAPQMLFIAEPGDGVGDGYVMKSVGGTAIARELLRAPRFEQARQRIPAQLGTILATLHAVPLSALPPLRVGTAESVIATMRRALDVTGEPHPVFELALSWLERRMPPAPATPGFVHGDFRTGNYLADEQGITAILDWEIAHLGDPLEDLGWLCVKSWRFGAVDKPAGGFGSREELWDAYEAAGGAKVNRDHARWWEILGTARWGVICMTQAWKHLSGAEESMELASIGRRAVETEVDLLELLG